ncbi:MerR family transcriptional regulator [Marinactinospora endophytica]
MRIGELSARTGVSRRSLRYYEEQGLLESTRAASGQRRFDEDAVRRVGLIQAFFAAGISSRVISEMLPCMTMRPTLEAARGSLYVMKRERARLVQARARLDGAVKALDGLIEETRQYQARLSSARPRAGTDRDPENEID